MSDQEEKETVIIDMDKQDYDDLAEMAALDNQTIEQYIEELLKTLLR